MYAYMCIYVYTYTYVRVCTHRSPSCSPSCRDGYACAVRISLGARVSTSLRIRWIGVGRNATGVAAMRFQRAERRREREESARVCAGHGTRCNDDGGGDFNGEGEGEKERGQREGGRKKDRLG